MNGKIPLVVLQLQDSLPSSPSFPGPNTKWEDALNIYMFSSGTLSHPRSYCNTDLHPEHRHLSQLEAIKLYLKGKEPLLQCEYALKACLWTGGGGGGDTGRELQVTKEP